MSQFYDILADAEAVALAAERRHFVERWERAHRPRDVFSYLLLAAGMGALAVGVLAALLLAGWLVGIAVSAMIG